MQRLFSTFADGWPGVGLLLQRVLVAILLLRCCMAGLTSVPLSACAVPQIVAAAAGLLLLIGLWTPIVGTLVAVLELWIAVSQVNDFWLSIVLLTLGATTAMIGPGAWSIDARLFGRKHLGT